MDGSKASQYEGDFEDESPVGVEGLNGNDEPINEASVSKRSQSASSNSHSRSSSSRATSRSRDVSHTSRQSVSASHSPEAETGNPRLLDHDQEVVASTGEVSPTAEPLTGHVSKLASTEMSESISATPAPPSADKTELLTLAKARLFAALPPTARLSEPHNSQQPPSPYAAPNEQTPKGANAKQPFVYPYPPWLKQAYTEAAAADRKASKKESQKINSARRPNDAENKLLLEDKTRPSSAKAADRLPPINQGQYQLRSIASTSPASTHLPPMLPAVVTIEGNRTSRATTRKKTSPHRNVPSQPLTQKQRLSIDVQIPDHRNDDCSYLPPNVRDAYARMRIEGIKDPSKISMDSGGNAIQTEDSKRSKSPLVASSFDRLRTDIDTVFAPTAKSSSIPQPAPPPKLVKQGLGGGGARTILIPTAPTPHPPGVAQYLRLAAKGPSDARPIQTSTDSSDKARRYAHRWLVMKGEDLGGGPREEGKGRVRSIVSNAYSNDMTSVGLDDTSSSAVYGIGRASSIATTAGMGASFASISKAKCGTKSKRRSPASRGKSNLKTPNVNTAAKGPTTSPSYGAAAEGKKNLHQPGDILPLEFDFVAPKHPVFEKGYEPPKRARPPPVANKEPAAPSTLERRQPSLSDAFGASARGTPLPMGRTNDIAGDPSDADDAIIRDHYTPPPTVAINEQHPASRTASERDSPANEETIEEPEVDTQSVTPQEDIRPTEMAKPDAAETHSDVAFEARQLASQSWRYPLAVTELAGNDVANETVDRAILTSAERMRLSGRRESNSQFSKSQSDEQNQSTLDGSGSKNDEMSPERSNPFPERVVPAPAPTTQEQSAESGMDIVAVARQLAANSWRYPLAVTELAGNDIANETVDRAILTSAERMRLSGRGESQNHSARNSLSYSQSERRINSVSGRVVQPFSRDNDLVTTARSLADSAWQVPLTVVK